MSSAIEKLARDGQLTAETFQQAVLEDMVNKIDWANVPVDKYVEELNNAKTLEAREDAVKSLGSLVTLDNQAALDALCIYPVSIQKWPFFAISASICGIACATYRHTSPRNPLISLTLRKITHF